jgi:ABC-type glycerol-3-phosphate transport system substrate-binding protein
VATLAANSTPVSDKVAASPLPSPEVIQGPSAPVTTPAETPLVALTRTSIDLTLWTIEAVSPQADGKAGEAFAASLRTFGDRYPNVSVKVRLKNVSGKGSVLDYLRTASQVAPRVLPDVVVLDTTEVMLAARAGVLVPLDAHIAPAVITDLLPAARAAGTVDGQLMGIPFEADVEHLVFNSSKIAAAPLTWSAILSANTTYRFPAKGRNGLVNDSFLIQYVALGGKLVGDDGAPFLDEQVLALVLEYYRQGVQVGVIPSDVLEAGDTNDLWPDYVAAKTGIVHVHVGRFLTDRNLLRSSQYADIPTQDGKPLTISRGRALAVTSRDPTQQAMAARLIEWMLDPDQAALWNQATVSIPTRYATFKRMGGDPYWEFLQHQMEVAVPAPAFPQYDQIGRVLQQAVVEVLSGDATPQDAAAAAVDAISR